MPEFLDAYRERTAYMLDSLPRSGGLRTAGGLVHKVAPGGQLLPFYGDTVIFDLPEDMKRWLLSVQDTLYAACGECLAQRLGADSFHITLHDLRSSPERMPDGIEQDREAVRAILRSAQDVPRFIRVRAVCALSMVSTSVVMGFEPESEADCHALMTLHERLQGVVALPYPLTLHATLAYYRPSEYGEETLWRLRDVLSRAGRERGVWTLDMRDLRFATFESMSAYQMTEASWAE